MDRYSVSLSGGTPIAARPDTQFDIAGFLERHGSRILGAARHYCATAADADDAYQRAVEKFLTKRPDERCDELLLAWTLTVVRNEALMIRRKNSQEIVVSIDEFQHDWHGVEFAPDDRLIEIENARRGSEALSRLNPDQARCLLLRAEGYSYEEICRDTGFNSSKVQRCLVEGRRVSRGLAGRIESGAECRRLEPMLSRLIDGELTPEQRADVDLHLRNCIACQATIREFAGAAREVASYFPLGGAAAAGVFASVAQRLSEVWAWFAERTAIYAPSSQAAEVAFGKKIAVATAVAGSILAGGAGLQGFTSSDRSAPVAPEVSPAIRLESPARPYDVPRTGPVAARTAAARQSSKASDVPAEGALESENVNPRPTDSELGSGPRGEPSDDSQYDADEDADRFVVTTPQEPGEPGAVPGG